MTAALILAAGSIEEGQRFAPTEEIGGMSPIKRLISVFQQAGVDRTVVVTGFNAERLERHCSRSDVIFLHNDAYKTSDMLSSVKLGLAYLKDKFDRVFITPADIPFFSIDTLRAMEAEVSAQVVIPICGVETGHPLLVSASAFGAILKYDGANGLKGILSSRHITRQFVDVSDLGILFDFRDDSGLDKLIASFPSPQIKADAKIWLVADKGFFGPGAFRLLSLLEETGSLKAACVQAGVSYGKARNVVATVENCLGYPVIERRRGGTNGGSSEITARGHELMRRYEAFRADCNEKVRELFERHFGDAEDLW